MNQKAMGIGQLFHVLTQKSKGCYYEILRNKKNKLLEIALVKKCGIINREFPLTTCSYQILYLNSWYLVTKGIRRNKRTALCIHEQIS